MKIVHIFLTIFLRLDGSTVGRHRSSTKGQVAMQVSGENRLKCVCVHDKKVLHSLYVFPRSFSRLIHIFNYFQLFLLFLAVLRLIESLSTLPRFFHLEQTKLHIHVIGCVHTLCNRRGHAAYLATKRRRPGRS
jgi:hypothetical protein